MTENQEIHDLLTYSLMNLDPRISDKRTVLICILVELSLFISKYSLTKEEILQEANRLVSQTNFLCESDCTQAIEECVKKRTVMLLENKYELSPARKEMLNKAQTNFRENLSQVENRLRDSIEFELGVPLDGELSSKIFIIIQKVVTSEIYDFSIHLARSQFSLENMVEQLESSEPIQKISYELEKILPEDRSLLKAKIIGGIINYYKTMPPELFTCLKIIHYDVLLNQILNLDPTIVRLQKEAFSKRKIYLDTNVVLSYFCEGHNRHSVVREIIDASKKIGVQFFISPITLTEINRQVDKAERNFLLLKRNRLAMRVANNGDDAILSTYLKIKRNQPSLEWELFITPFRNMEEMIFSSDFLVEEEGFEEIKKIGEDPIIRKAIADSKPLNVHEKVIEHDTLNFSLILYLREKYPPDLNGQKIWLLTIDHTLKKAQRILYGAKIISCVYCMQISEWGEIVIPLQAIVGLEFNDFIGYLAQARLGAIADPEIIQLDFLETIQDAPVDVDRLLKLSSTQVRSTLVKLQTDRETRITLTRIKNPKNDEEKQQLQLEFDSKLSQILDETDPSKIIIDQLNKKLELFSKKFEMQEGQITVLSRELSMVKRSFIYRFIFWIINIFKKETKSEK
jgi:hypothetical protein